MKEFVKADVEFIEDTTFTGCKGCGDIHYFDIKVKKGEVYKDISVSQEFFPPEDLNRQERKTKGCKEYVSAVIEDFTYAVIPCSNIKITIIPVK